MVEHTIRTKNGKLKKVKITKNIAIKLMCTECLGYGEAHPSECSSVNCPLYPFRGKTLMGLK